MSYVMEERVFIAIVIKYSFISRQNIHTGHQRTHNEDKQFKYDHFDIFSSYQYA